jgi:hypothetical protein
MMPLNLAALAATTTTSASGAVVRTSPDGAGEGFLELLAPLLAHTDESHPAPVAEEGDLADRVHELVDTLLDAGSAEDADTALVPQDEEPAEVARWVLHAALRADAAGRTRPPGDDLASLGSTREGHPTEELSPRVDTGAPHLEEVDAEGLLQEVEPSPTAAAGGDVGLPSFAGPADEAGDPDEQAHIGRTVPTPESTMGPVARAAVDAPVAGEDGDPDVRTSLRSSRVDVAVTATPTTEGTTRSAEVRDTGALRPGTPAVVDRILEAASRLEHLPPPRHLVLEVGELRVRLSLDDAGLRLQLLDDAQAADQDLLREASDELRSRGFDLADGEADDSSSRAANQLAEAARDEATAGTAPASEPAAARPDTALRL